MCQSTEIVHIYVPVKKMTMVLFVTKCRVNEGKQNFAKGEPNGLQTEAFVNQDIHKRKLKILSHFCRL